VLDREFAVLNGGVVTGKAFDDRVAWRSCCTH